MFSCTQERRERHMVSFIVKDLERYPMGKNSYLIVKSKMYQYGIIALKVHIG